MGKAFEAYKDAVNEGMVSAVVQALRIKAGEEVGYVAVGCWDYPVTKPDVASIRRMEEIWGFRK